MKPGEAVALAAALAVVAIWTLGVLMVGDRWDELPDRGRILVLAGAPLGAGLVVGVFGLLIWWIG